MADLLIGAVLNPGARAPRIVTEEMIKTMQLSSVVADVAIDQGGSIEKMRRGSLCGSEYSRAVIWC